MSGPRGIWTADSGFTRIRRADDPRFGLTLIELLVVMAILAILVSTAIPVLSPAGDDRRIREASRGVNTFLSGAQTRAKGLGRPFGVAFKKLSQDTGRPEDNGVCLEMYYVQQPAPYAGFDENSRVMLAQDQDGAGVVVRGQFLVRFVTSGDTAGDDLPPRIDLDLLPAVIRFGDRLRVGGFILQFNDQGSSRDMNGFYNDTDSTMGAKVVTGNSLLTNVVDQLVNPVFDSSGSRIANGGTVDDGPYWTAPLRYKILRQPTKTSNEPYQLPEGTAIDLEASGFGNGFRLHEPLNNGGPDNDDDTVLMFAPDGSIERLVLNRTDEVTSPGITGTIESTLVTSNLFLLVGLRENIPAPTTDFNGFSGTPGELEEARQKINWLNGDCRWVSVGAQTGAVVTSDNAYVDPVPIANNVTYDTIYNRRLVEINGASELARQRDSAGGR